MPNVGFPELIVILVIALIIFGPGKLPAIGGAIGKAIGEFKKASKELMHGGRSEENTSAKVVEKAQINTTATTTTTASTETTSEKV